VELFGSFVIAIIWLPLLWFGQRVGIDLGDAAVGLLLYCFIVVWCIIVVRTALRKQYVGFRIALIPDIAK
jgi:hypothetical protein